MWKDNDFRELFQNYRVDPPQKVWSNVTAVLEKNRNQRVVLPYFSNYQRFTLVAASLSAIILCGFMLRFMKESPSRIGIAEPNFVAEQNTISLNELEIVNRKTIPTLSSLPTLPSSSITLTKKIRKPSIILPEEYKPFEKDILALAELDKQIAELGKEIDKLNNIEPLQYEWNTPTIAQVQSKTESKANQNWKVYQSQLKDEIIPVPTENKLVEASVTRPKFIERFYLTPYMGANYTQVFYQDKPTNNYFSDKAQFSGQIGYNSGVQFGFQLNKKWSLESGIGLGQYILGFKEDYGTYFRDGHMYIDQLDIPLLMRYTIGLNNKKLPLTLALKGGLIYSNVIFYQINYTDKFNRIISIGSPNEQSFKFDVDKRQYNSMQFGYAAGFDLDAFVSNKISLNLSMLNALVSQINNFPFFGAERQRPIQFSTSFSIGTKIRF